jgi:hypothetical protein
MARTGIAHPRNDFTSVPLQAARHATGFQRSNRMTSDNV